MVGLLNSPPYGGGLLAPQQSSGLLGSIANFFRPWTPEDRAKVAAVMPPDLAPTQIVKGALGGMGSLAMQAHQAMPWGGNDPSAIGIDTQAGTIDPSVMIPFAQNVAGMVGTGGMASPKPAGALGIFGGRMAKTADQAALAKAEQMAAAGASRDAIWHETGWFQGVDGKWRFEIPDGASRLNPRKYGEGIPDQPNVAPAADQLWHEDLYNAYPGLRTQEMTVKKGSDGGRHSSDGNIEIRPASAASGRSVALHEMQHAVQQIEEFTPGGSPQSLWNHSNPEISNAVKAEWDRLMSPISKEEFEKTYSRGWEPTPEQIDQAYLEYVTGTLKARRDPYNIANKAAQETAAQTVYKRLAGEVEARNVQKRMNMSVDERSELPPWWSQDVPDARQIVHMPEPSYTTGGRF